MASTATPHTLRIPLVSGEPLEIDLEPGTSLFVVGANGSGKSALVQHATKTLGIANIHRIAAHRQTWLFSSHVNLSPAERQHQQQYLSNEDDNSDRRWQDNHGSTRVYAALFDLSDMDNAHARRIRDAVGIEDWATVKTLKNGQRPPFKRINDLLARAGLPIAIENTLGGEIIAQHKKSTARYGMAQLSDGERNAVLIAANVLTAEKGTVLLVDEPERHLHRAIIEPFLSALFAERDDCTFIIATHEVALPLANPGARVLVTYSCRWNGEKPHAWDAKLLEADTELPEDLKRAILGARKAILFVEGGQSQSLDLRLYSALFPDITVSAAGSCNDVIRAVSGLRQTESRHDTKAFGLIDRDDRDEAEVNRLASIGIYALDAYSVESLYYCSDAIEAVAERQATTYGNDAKGMVQDAKCQAINALKATGTADHMADHLCGRRTEAKIIKKFRCKKLVRGDANGQAIVKVPSSHQDEVAEFKRLLNAEDLDAITARYPVRESRLPGVIARALKHRTPSDYQQAVLARIPGNTALVNSLRQKIEPLAQAIREHQEAQA